ncbi:MAG: flagellar protein FlgN [Opitutaceae bacterium]|nr:flagellar protein FlgN [Opitutaceae bacterium]
MTSTPTRLEAGDWEPLVEILRNELQEYGGLFNLLGQQQDRIIERKPDAVLSINDEIELQTRTVADLRGRREAFVDDLLARVGQPVPGSLRKLIEHLPDFVQPLVEALMTDINHMVRRNRHKARQNHLLLSRAVQLTEETLRVLQPENFTRTYGRTGRATLPTRAAAVSRYNALG